MHDDPVTARPTLGEAAAFAEAAALLLVLRVGIGRVPFRRLARWCGLHAGEPANAALPAPHEPAIGVGIALRRAARRVPWEATCLMQALAGAAMLRRRRVGATVHLGVARDDASDAGLAAHAWLRAGDLTLTGGAESDRFSPVAAYHLR